MTKCAVLTCTNEADPRWFVRDMNNRAVEICDGHDPMPRPDEVTVRPPDPSAYDLAERIVCNGYSPTPAEVACLSHALIVECARVKERDEELAKLRDLAFAIHADIELSPAQLEVKQRLIADRYARQAAKAADAFAKRWTTAQRSGVAIVRCRRCGFEAFPFADAVTLNHEKVCTPEAR